MADEKHFPATDVGNAPGEHPEQLPVYCHACLWEGLEEDTDMGFCPRCSCVVDERLPLQADAT